MNIGKKFDPSKSLNLLHGDCLELMKEIPDSSIDCCITDPPYGTTACKWDTVIPFEPMWKELKRIVKDNGAICLFGVNPFTANLIMSNPKNYKYDWVWKKQRGTGHLNAKKQPMRDTELISVFYCKPCDYFPQGLVRGVFENGRPSHEGGYDKSTYRKTGRAKTSSYGNYPKTTLEFNANYHHSKKFHTTQKPVALLEYLIKTYTLKNETVLDFTVGSGTTCIAANNLQRKSIGIEKDEAIFNTAKRRIISHCAKKYDVDCPTN